MSISFYRLAHPSRPDFITYRTGLHGAHKAPGYLSVCQGDGPGTGGSQSKFVSANACLRQLTPTTSGAFGLKTSDKVWVNTTTDHPDDWDVAVGTLYPNWAAVDQLEAKATTLVTKHYGSREAMLEAGKKRNEIRDVVMSKLAHEVIPK